MKNNTKIKLFIFDLDGTLADTLPGIAAALRHVMGKLECEKLGLDMPTDDFVRRNIGGGAKNLMQNALGKEADGLLSTALPLFSDYYAENATVGVSLYPGVPETLDRLAEGHRMAVVTAKARAATLSVLEYLGISKYFDVVITANDVRKPKPDPEGVGKILEELRERPQCSMLIGDTQTDVATAKNAGIVSCVVTYGYGVERIMREASYDHIVDAFPSILDFV